MIFRPQTILDRAKSDLCKEQMAYYDAQKKAAHVNAQAEFHRHEIARFERLIEEIKDSATETVSSIIRYEREKADV